MRRMQWLLGGVVLGFVAAHFVNRNPEGRRFFDRVNRGLDEFGRAFAAGYREEESGAPDSLDDVEVALRNLTDKR